MYEIVYMLLAAKGLGLLFDERLVIEGRVGGGVSVFAVSFFFPPLHQVYFSIRRICLFPLFKMAILTKKH